MVDDLVALLATLGVSAVPGLELRAGIPLGMAMGLPSGVATAAAIAGNALQIPVATWVVAGAYRYVTRVPAIKRWITRVENQVERHKPLVQRWGWLGMAFFVVIPGPATGVWGGVVIARLVRMQGWAVWTGLSLGLLISGLMAALTTIGAFSAWRHLFS